MPRISSAYWNCFPTGLIESVDDIVSIALLSHRFSCANVTVLAYSESSNESHVPRIPHTKNGAEDGSISSIWLCALEEGLWGVGSWISQRGLTRTTDLKLPGILEVGSSAATSSECGFECNSSKHIRQPAAGVGHRKHGLQDPAPGATKPLQQTHRPIFPRLAPRERSSSSENSLWPPLMPSPPSQLPKRRAPKQKYNQEQKEAQRACRSIGSCTNCRKNKRKCDIAEKSLGEPCSHCTHRNSRAKAQGKEPVVCVSRKEKLAGEN